MERKMRAVMEGAKENLLKDKRLMTVALLSTGDHLNASLMMPWKDDDQKYVMLKTIGEECRKKSYDNVIVISDAAMRMATPESLKDPLERPLLYPESMRKECIVIMGYDFKAEKSLSLVQIYKAQTLEFEGDPEFIVGKMGGDIIDSIKEGYKL